jgi:hypothetical protein
MVTRRCAAALVVSLLAGLGPARGAEPPPLMETWGKRPKEHEVKAAFLYNFAKFVKWPDNDPRSPTFVIAVLGEDPFGSVLDRTVAGKTVLGRSVEVKRLQNLDATEPIHILFVGESEKKHLPEIWKRLEGTSVLTVGEMDSFAERGGMIAFKVREDVVQFEINLGSVERARLKMSSQLIRLARQVIDGGKGS